MNWRLHPDAALEHEEQVAYYEERRVGLGARYHSATMLAITSTADPNNRYRLIQVESHLTDVGADREG